MNGPSPETQEGLSSPQDAPSEPRKRLTSEQVALVLKLRAEGLSYRAIQAETGFSKGAVGRALKTGSSRLNPSERAARKKAQQAERARRYRERKKAQARADFRASRSADARPAADPPSGGLHGEPEFERPKHIVVQEHADSPSQRLRFLDGSHARFTPPRAQPRRRRGDVGLGRVLNDNDARREARERALEAGLDLEGMAAVRLLDSDGNTVMRCSFDPFDSADLERAADLTGLSAEYLSRAAHDPAAVAEMRAGLRPPDQNGGDVHDAEPEPSAHRSVHTAGHVPGVSAPDFLDADATRRIANTSDSVD